MTPLTLSLIVLFILELGDIRNPIFFLTNTYYIEGYQVTSQNKASDEIVIVNISDFSTEEIKDQIYILSKYNPAVIGVDYFSSEEIIFDSEPVNFKNTVLPILISPSDSVQYSKNLFTEYAEYGSIRVYSPSIFEPFVEVDEKKYPSFPTKILQLYNQSSYKNLIKRGYKREVINYSGNIANFIYLGDLTEIKTLDVLKEVKGKIVLLGYTGIETTNPTTSDNYDSHDTPKGKMFGVVILANILHTLLGNYITPAPLFSMAVLIIALAFFNTLILNLLSKNKFQYLIIKMIQLAEIIIAFIVSSYLIHQFNISVDYELTSFTILIAPEIAYWCRKAT